MSSFENYAVNIQDVSNYVGFGLILKETIFGQKVGVRFFFEGKSSYGTAAVSSKEEFEAQHPGKDVKEGMIFLMISNSTLRILHTVHGFGVNYFSSVDKGSIALTEIDAEFGKKTNWSIADRQGLRAIYRSIVKFGFDYKNIKVDKENMNLSLLLSSLMVIKGISDGLEYYFEDPDAGIEILETETLEGGKLSFHHDIKDILKAMNEDGLKRQQENGNISHTLSYSECVAMLILVSMTKTYGENSAGYNKEKIVAEFSKTRLLAYVSTCKFPDMIAEKDDIEPNQFVDIKVLGDLSSIMDSLPKLKSAIFRFVIPMRDTSILCNYVSTIAKDSQLTTFHMIVLFLSTRKITLAHVDPEVMKDMAKFMPRFKSIRQKYGELWAYCKLLNPLETEVVTSDIESLRDVSIVYVAYQKWTGQKKTIQQFKPLQNVSISKHIDKVCRVIKKEHVKEVGVQETKLMMNEYKDILPGELLDIWDAVAEHGPEAFIEDVDVRRQLEEINTVVLGLRK